MRFKHLGATMLAGALAMSMVLAPTTHALAYTADGAGTRGTYRNGNSSLINENTNVVLKYSYAELKALEANDAKTYDELVAKYGSPYSANSDWEVTYISGVKYYIITETTFENTLNGKTSDDLDDVTSEIGIPKTLAINTKSLYALKVEFNAGNVGIANLKSSKKNVAVVSKVSEKKTITSGNVYISTDSKRQKFFYTGAYGERIYVADKNVLINDSEGEATILINAKKKGTAKITFDVVNYQGQKTGSKTITVKVKDTTPFKELTYAGKNLISTSVAGKEDKNYIYYGTDYDKEGTKGAYTTTAKGSLVVKMNSDYKLVKIEIGKLYQEKINSNLDKTDNKSLYEAGKKKRDTYTDADQFDEYSAVKVDGHLVDLNGDGDYLDTINGISESGSTWKFTTVKNKAKITLSKVKGDESEYSKKYSSQAYISQTRTDENGVIARDDNGEIITDYTMVDNTKYTQTSSSSKGLYAPTLVRVTYFDKTEKSYKVYTDIIYLKTSK
jgi:hypothetical protein